jgi:hypothetical protein
MEKLGRQWRDREQSRSVKHTAWRRKRSFGRAFGGDGVGRPADYIPSHALPCVVDAGPVLVENRPHPDYLFPITGEEALARIRELPKADTEGITHVWLRRMAPKDDRPFGSYCYGPDYAVIVLYPWPKTLSWWLGPRPPSRFSRWLTENFGGELGQARGYWFARFTFEGARRFFLDHLILHEVGHHVDWRHFSDANDKRVEEFANQYAATWSRKLRRFGNGTTPQPKMTKAGFRQLESTLAAAFPYWTARIVHKRHDGPTPELTVSFRLFDRHGRARSNTAWIRPAETPGLTAEGMRLRIERANASWRPKRWNVGRGQ